MILNKQVGVFLNLVHFRFKQYLSAIFAKHGYDLTPEQFLVLDTLWDDGVLSQQELADILKKDKNSVTKLIDALERKRLVERIPDKIDRRLNLIHITELAKSMKDNITDIALDCTNQIIKDIPEEDLNVFVSVLNKMAENMSSSDNNCGDGKAL
ncbi:MAG: MarR family transcriptional regulator [Bacteroidales bacterium]|jgi:DNA-binding MarR family transcriptional regulator